MYPSINIEKTGKRLKEMINIAGYDVKYIQRYLHLACPNSIYRWFKGKILPSVEHLSALSVLLGVHIDELLVLNDMSLFSSIKHSIRKSGEKRMFCYYGYMVMVA